MNTNDEKLTIQQVAEATGLSVHTLRYYERIGLIHSINRAENTHRRYTQGDIGWIDFLNKLRAVGMPIQQMQTYATLQREGDHTIPERLEMLRTLQQNLILCINEMHQNLELLNHKIDFYENVQSEIVEPS